MIDDLVTEIKMNPSFKSIQDKLDIDFQETAWFLNLELALKSFLSINYGLNTGKSTDDLADAFIR